MIRFFIWTSISLYHCSTLIDLFSVLLYSTHLLFAFVANISFKTLIFNMENREFKTSCFWNLQVRGLQQHTDIKDMAAVATLVILNQSFNVSFLHIVCNFLIFKIRIQHYTTLLSVDFTFSFHLSTYLFGYNARSKFAPKIQTEFISFLFVYQIILRSKYDTRLTHTISISFHFLLFSFLSLPFLSFSFPPLPFIFSPSFPFQCF